MPSYSCGSCGQQVAIGLKVCPHCGRPARPKAGNDAGASAVAAAIVIVPVIALLAWCFGGSPSPSGSARRPEHDAVTAYVVCKQFVEERLRAPRTAKFPWGYSDKVADLGGGRYRARAYVDAQNAFGAMIRSSFDCTVQWTGGDRWRLEALTID